MMICQPLIDAKLLPNRNHCRRFHSAQGIRTPLRRRGVLRSDHGCPTPRADGCKRCLHLSCGELTIISRTPTRARIDYGLHSKWTGIRLVRDEGVAGSNPATPTSFLKNGNHSGARYGERNPCLAGLVCAALRRQRSTEVRILSGAPPSTHLRTLGIALLARQHGFFE